MHLFSFFNDLHVIISEVLNGLKNSDSSMNTWSSANVIWMLCLLTIDLTCGKSILAGYMIRNCNTMIVIATDRYIPVVKCSCNSSWFSWSLMIKLNGFFSKHVINVGVKDKICCHVHIKDSMMFDDTSCDKNYWVMFYPDVLCI